MESKKSSQAPFKVIFLIERNKYIGFICKNYDISRKFQECKSLLKPQSFDSIR